MDENPKNFYANAVNIAGSIFDVTFIFRSQSPQFDAVGNMINLKGEQPVLNVNDEITVRMSPQHAKALAGLLVQSIVQYEKQFQIKLPLPPELEQIWNEYLKGK